MKKEKNMFNFLLSNANVDTSKELAELFSNMIKKILGPVLIVVGAAAACYLIYLGVMYAKAEDANKRKEVQGRLIACVIGFVIIMVGIIVCYAIPWANLFDSWSKDADATTKVFINMLPFRR